MIPAALLDAARAAHATPGRVYHTLDHALAVRREVLATPGWDDAVAAELAALLHDAVYVPGAPGNEAASAALAAELLPLHGLDRHLPAVTTMILATAGHGRLGPGDVDADTARFLDADTAILGADADTFDAYDAGVAAEWSGVVPPEAWLAGRRAFLAGLLARPRIFLTEAAHARLDAPARANLRRALTRLESP